MHVPLVLGIFAERWSKDPYFDSQLNNFYRLKEVERKLQEAEMRVDHMERHARAAIDLVIAAEARIKKLKNEISQTE